MKARVKNSYLVGRVTAFGGREYINKEWREVPPGHKDEARRHALLEIHEVKAEQDKPTAQDLPGRWVEGATVEAEPETTVTAEAEGTNEPSRATQQRSSNRKRRSSNR